MPCRRCWIPKDYVKYGFGCRCGMVVSTLSHFHRSKLMSSCGGKSQ